MAAIPPNSDEEEFDDTITAKAAKHDIKFVNWKSKLQPGMLICLVNGHGNMLPSEWKDERETTLDMATALSASLGNPGFVSDSAIIDMVRPVTVSIEQNKTMEETADLMISSLKTYVGRSPREKKFQRSSPEKSGVSNIFRNRSWDFEIGSTDKFYFYQFMLDRTVRVFTMEPTAFTHTVHGNRIRVFKSDFIDVIEGKYKRYSENAGRPITKFLLLDGACNGKDCEGMSSSELRAFVSTVGELDLNGKSRPKKLGGTKRKHTRKSLKKKFK